MHFEKRMGGGGGQNEPVLICLPERAAAAIKSKWLIKFIMDREVEIFFESCHNFLDHCDMNF